ncbi:MAG: PhnD/SsuA/transferrin family substrate-binding protein [Thioalkalivibrionaceae bacterium]
MNRRRFLSRAALLPWILPAARGQAGTHGPVRIGLTPVFLDDQAAFVDRWRGYLERRLGRLVVFVQRASYREVSEQLLNGGVDFAWMCGYPYLRNRTQLRLLAVPLFQGRPLYQSYLIVPATDTSTRNLVDLRARVFAYADPNSNSGWLVTQAELRSMGEDPGLFFRRSFFTWAHRKVVEAVGVGLAHGGAVDGYIWEALHRLHPELTERTRIVQRSQTFGFPPWVTRQGVDDEIFSDVQQVLLGMNQDAEGLALLKELFLDGFSVQEEGLYDGIETLMQRAGLT